MIISLADFHPTQKQSSHADGSPFQQEVKIRQVFWQIEQSVSLTPRLCEIRKFTIRLIFRGFVSS